MGKKWKNDIDLLFFKILGKFFKFSNIIYERIRSFFVSIFYKLLKFKFEFS